MIDAGSRWMGPWLGAMRSDIEVLDLLQVLLDDLAEGHHDLGIVALGLGQDAVDPVDEEIRLGHVGAEPVAAEEDAVLFEIGRHGLGPVDPGREDEPEGLAAEREPLAVGDRPDPGRVEAEVVDEHGLGRLGREKHGFGIALEDPGQTARMILFRVVGDDVVDLRDALQVGPEDIELLGLDGVDERDLVAAGHEIGVIARPVGQGDEGVEKPPVEVRSPDVVDAGNDLSGFHIGDTP